MSLNATENWWGNDSGPYHAELNPNGTGDGVCDSIDFSNWTRLPEDHVAPVGIIDADPGPVILEYETISLSGHGESEYGIVRFIWERGGYHWYNGLEETYERTLSGGQLVILNFSVEDEWGSISPERTIEFRFTARPVATIIFILPVYGGGVQVQGNGTDDRAVVNYSISSNVGGELYLGSESMPKVFDLEPGNQVFSLRVQDDDGVWSVNATLAYHVRNDYDLDGILDPLDAFPKDPAASDDFDGDGYPDKWNPYCTEKDSIENLTLDQYPGDPDRWNDNQDDSGSGFLPGFEIALVLLAIVISLLIGKGRTRGKQ